MRILHTADWHIGNFPGPEKDGKNLRAMDTINCLQQLYNTACLEHPDIILVSGDIFHQARVWADRGLGEVKVAINTIEALSAVCPVLVLRGTPNHDGEEQFELLKAHFQSNHRVSIITEPKVLSVYTGTHEEGGLINIAGLPGFDRGVFRARFPGLSREEENQVFTEELGKIVLGLRAQCEPGAPAVLMSHYTVPGCSTESGQTQFLAQFEPVLMPDVLDAAGFNLTALGHIHRPQAVPSCRYTFYSGAVNALNFNDEEQFRGFWIHDLEEQPPHEIIRSNFVMTPAREFLTIRLQSMDVETLNNGGHYERSDIADKIVRVLYSCTDEHNKAFNKAQLEKELYAAGAFWVSEISPEQITATVNKHEMSDKTDPVTNLIDYLYEKGYSEEKTAEVVNLALPIIHAAVAGAASAQIHGVFEPLEIEVVNYRNYAQERFSFRDISFCTINGRNGAGKSSLFMDAILDCLFEEPREGDLTGWIRNANDARSGSISFTFRIGDRTFRVVRTRAKSGKATLNLAEHVDSEWVSRSKERAKDTQDEIVALLGMDSLTFRSCALIMQDQYGLFLQADKEDRMTILGNILGLGIYGDMEEAARENAAVLNRQISMQKAAAALISEAVAGEANLSEDLSLQMSSRNQLETENKRLVAERDNINIRLNVAQAAARRAEKLTQNIKSLGERKRELEENKAAQEAIVTGVDILLLHESDVLTGVAKYQALLEKEKQLLAGKATFDAKNSERDKVSRDSMDAQKALLELQTEKSRLEAQLRPLLEKLGRETELKAAVDRYRAEKVSLAEMEQKAERYIRISSELGDAERCYSEEKARFDASAAERVTTLNGYEETAALLSKSGCIDPENASCAFLKRAKEAKAAIEPYRAQCSKWKEDAHKKLGTLKGAVEKLRADLNALNYDAKVLAAKRSDVNSLEPAIREYESLTGCRDSVTLIRGRLSVIEKSLAETETRITAQGKEFERLSSELELLLEADEAYTAITAQISANKIWLEKEKELPVAREKKQAAENRTRELIADILKVTGEIQESTVDLETELIAADGTDTLKDRLKEVDGQLSANQEQINAAVQAIGSLKQRLEEISQKKNKLSELQQEITSLSDQVVIYEELKRAFSQDGIPHNIIRSIIPLITATANNILGQMTGGKMGMEFVTEKILKSNKGKEVVTLDILIEEAGKGTLPYLSKSGGEKVKASLSAILALAETKSTQAGIQLGILFIDEPPFLDSDGIQAYCDALETIQHRYQGLKIMAITHDPSMKARFPQSLDVVKDDAGSRVIFN